MYINELEAGLTSTGYEAEPTIIKQTVLTTLVDSNNVLGPVVGNFRMDIALKKAKETGIGCVTARGSNHFGIAGWYTIQAMKQEMLGMSFTNTIPLLIPTRANQTEIQGMKRELLPSSWAVDGSGKVFALFPYCVEIK